MPPRPRRAAAVSPHLRRRPVEPADPIRMGVLGTASIAWRRVLPAMAAVPGMELVATASRRREKAQRFADRFGGVAVEGYERLLARDDLDAVYIPLPATLHAEWAARALRAGLHVLCEKPMTSDRHGTARLLNLARERGLTVMENLMFPHHSQHETVRELLDAGRIGELRSLTAEFAFPPKPPGDMRYLPVGGGALVEIGVYPLSTALLRLGEDLEVLGAVLRHDGPYGVDLSGAALLADPRGVPAHLTWGMEHGYRSSYELWGTAGRIVVEWAYTPPPSHSPVVRVETQGRQERITLPPDDQFANVLHAFAEAVRGTDIRDCTDRSLRLAELMDEVAARAGLSGTDVSRRLPTRSLHPA
ncbi:MULTISPECIES: Gfo/Idh/MocA family protein [unclassified Streptomyces]|uniref:Gfo/Idh/MocA family protein n=1 Tax=unclassified Streptomyces TaxID=2593676 RepID=UPI00278C0F4E|nr:MULTISPECIES: Gfo/Idh/MocA family oxidoreductase [unclassified Streptomyces]